jgi:hypothetical protein
MRPGVAVGEGVGDAVGDGDMVGVAVIIGDGAGVTVVATGAHAVATTSATIKSLTELP